MPSRVLLVSSDPLTQRVVATALRGAGHELASAANANDGMARWVESTPDLVVVDHVIGGTQGHAFVESLRRAEVGAAHVNVLVLGPDRDVESMVGALRAGADDYVAKPVNPAELIARVSGLLARAAPPAKSAPSVGGRVLAWYGAKGGVGTTTLAINTAIALQRETAKGVVLVDAALQLGDHRVFLDLGADRHSIVDACAMPVVDPQEVAASLVRHSSGIDLLLAPFSPEGADRVSAEHHHLQQIVEALRTTHEFVLVDLDKRLDDHTLDVIGLADVLLMVMTADLSCLKNLRLLLPTFEQLGVSPERIALVLNRSNAQTGINAASAERVLPHPIAHRLVNDYRTAIGSLNSGTPFMVNRADSNLAKGVLKLARSLVAAPVEQPAPVRTGRFSAAFGPALSR